MAASDYGSKHTKVLDRNRMAASRRRACVDRRETAFSRVATRVENAPPSGGSGPVRLLQREQGAAPIMGVQGFQPSGRQGLGRRNVPCGLSPQRTGFEETQKCALPFPEYHTATLPCNLGRVGAAAFLRGWVGQQTAQGLEAIPPCDTIWSAGSVIKRTPNGARTRSRPLRQVDALSV